MLRSRVIHYQKPVLHSPLDWLFAPSKIIAIGLLTALQLGSVETFSSIGIAQEESRQLSDREGIDFFETKIRPVLIEHCYECHSTQAHESGDLRGGLLLDSRQSILEGGDSGPALVPNEPEESLIIGAMRHEDYEMPPDGKLSDQIIADFERWIEIGAPDPRDGTAIVENEIDFASARDFWSLKPLSSPQINLEKQTWGHSAIDAFVEELHQANGLHGNELASAQTLVRRVWFDLLGLPPTPEEMNTWTDRLTMTRVNQTTIDLEQYEQLIDHLLSSPHYGERWARHWMDIARFAESHGYEQDYNRPNAYHYRDFLIRAFNEDLPFDTFVQWQIAGDELAPDDPRALMATGFLGGGAFPTQLTEAEFESARYDELDDMVATIGVSFMGLSIGCARCHDHKFDPISSDDYYRFVANFSKTIRTEIELDLNPDRNARLVREWNRQEDQLAAILGGLEDDLLPDRFEDWLNESANDPIELKPWSPLQGTLSSSSTTTYAEQSDGSFLATGETPNGETITFLTSANSENARAIRLETLSHESLPGGGPGRAPNGNFALGDIRIFRVQANEETEVSFVRAEATFQQNNGNLAVAASIDDDAVSGWAVDGQIGSDQAAVFWLDDEHAIQPGDTIRIELDFHHPNTKHTPGRLRFAMTSMPEPPVTTDQLGPAQVVLEAIDRLKHPENLDLGIRQSEEWQVAFAWFKTTQPDWVEAHTDLQSHRAAGPSVPKDKVMISSEGLPHLSHHADGRGFPHFYPETYYLRRGDVDQKGDVAEPGFLTVLTPPDRQASDWQIGPRHQDRTQYHRAALAHWITDIDHGAGALTARVIVNRLWQHHFGRGIVATPNDFGRSGEAPTHPRLLEWLAASLVESNWKLKPLHKEILLSKTYMQSTAHDDERHQIDIDNRFWWRRNPRRLEAEPIRDALLAVSGSLDETMYGPGTLDPMMKRRSVYFFIKRSQLIPMMMMFDWPEHLVSIGQRSSTTIAPQALMLLNDPFCVEAASRLESVLPEISSEPSDTNFSSRFESLVWRCYGRAPSEQETESARSFVASQIQHYESSAIDNAETRAWTDLCQAILAASEFIYID